MVFSHVSGYTIICLLIKVSCTACKWYELVWSYLIHGIKRKDVDYIGLLGVLKMKFPWKEKSGRPNNMYINVYVYVYEELERWYEDWESSTERYVRIQDCREKAKECAKVCAKECAKVGAQYAKYRYYMLHRYYFVCLRKTKWSIENRFHISKNRHLWKLMICNLRFDSKYFSKRLSDLIIFFVLQ